MRFNQRLLKDLNISAWYHDGVHYAIESGLMNGVDKAKFSPNGTATRAQIVTILWRMENGPASEYAMSFEDVPDGKWYTEAIRWAAGNEIVLGYNGKFSPNDPVTREQLATILWRYAKYKGYDISASKDISTFSDAGTVSNYALDAMKWAFAEGIIQGTSGTNGTLRLAPKGSATRAQTATMMMRAEKV